MTNESLAQPSKWFLDMKLDFKEVMQDHRTRRQSQLALLYLWTNSLFYWSCWFRKVSLTAVFVSLQCIRVNMLQTRRSRINVTVLCLVAWKGVTCGLWSFGDNLWVAHVNSDVCCKLPLPNGFRPHTLTVILVGRRANDLTRERGRKSEQEMSPETDFWSSHF